MLGWTSVWGKKRFKVNTEQISICQRPQHKIKIAQGRVGQVPSFEMYNVNCAKYCICGKEPGKESDM